MSNVTQLSGIPPAPSRRNYRGRQDLTAQRFGRLTVMGPGPKLGKDWAWAVRCDCGADRAVRAADLRSGRAQSCGCLHAERTSKASLRHGHARGESRSQVSLTYQTWRGMKNRCQNPRQKNFKHYGGRGIRICERWANSFEAFLTDVGERPSADYTLDRIDVNGHYEPGNCRWATAKEQSANKRRAKARGKQED